MLELYHNDLSTCAQKVRIALAEKGLDWTGHMLDLRAGDQRKPDYVKLNPNKVVPTLVHDGKPVIESTAILEYLDETFPEPALRPMGEDARAVMRGWMEKLDGGMHPMTGVVSTCIAFRYDFLKKTEDELVEWLAGVDDPMQREMRKAMIQQGTDFPAFPMAVNKFDEVIAEMEDALQKGPWLVGQDYSLADISWTPYMARLNHLGMSILWEDRPAVADWWTRLQARPSFDTAITQVESPDKVAIMNEKGIEEAEKIRAALAA